MNKVLNNKFEMLKTVRDWLGAHLAVLAFLTRIQGLYESLCDQLEEIAKNDAEAKKGTVGHTRAKSAVQTQMEDIIIDIIARLVATATFNKDYVLLHTVNYTDSQIRHTSDQHFQPRYESVLNAAKENAELALEDGLTPEMIAQAEELLESYKSLKTSPRQAVVSRSDLIDKVEDGVNEAMLFLDEQLDATMNTLKITNPDLLKQYREARIIIDR